MEAISAYFEIGDVAAYRRLVARDFRMPERPLARVSVIDFHGMEYGTPYFEAVVSILVHHGTRPGWQVLTMPVTDGDSCAGGRFTWGYPKIVRRVTLERSSRRAVGTLYAEDTVTTDFTLTVTAGGAPSTETTDFLRFVSPMPNFPYLTGRVLVFGGFPSPIYELERVRPDTWRVQLGDARLEFPRAPENALAQLDVGRPLAAYRLQQRARYSMTPRE
jgi:hypothetical protein